MEGPSGRACVNQKYVDGSRGKRALVGHLPELERLFNTTFSADRNGGSFWHALHVRLSDWSHPVGLLWHVKRTPRTI